MPPNDKLNSRDLTTILFSVYVRWVQPLSATWFRLQVDRLGLTDERGSRPCFYARQLQLVCVRPSVSCSLRCLHLWCWTLMLNNPIFCLCTVFFFIFFKKILCRVPLPRHSAKFFLKKMQKSFAECLNRGTRQRNYFKKIKKTLPSAWAGALGKVLFKKNKKKTLPSVWAGALGKVLF